MLQGQTAHLHLVTTATSCLALLLGGIASKCSHAEGQAGREEGTGWCRGSAWSLRWDSPRGGFGASCRGPSLSLKAASPGCAPGSTGA